MPGRWQLRPPVCREHRPGNFVWADLRFLKRFRSGQRGTFGCPFFCRARRRGGLTVFDLQTWKMSPELVAPGHALVHLCLKTWRAEGKPVLILAIDQETRPCQSEILE